mmetsp:Transcript_21006/g.60728  ORF Transcript_21006/g.60728 Transcript_21006/m.60728 type:complete len:220 (+) Transcript_21006:1319-1978(+)
MAARTRSLKASSGSPTATTATLRQLDAGYCRKASARVSASRFPCTSMTTRSRGLIMANRARAPCTLPSLSPGTAKPAQALSLDRSVSAAFDKGPGRPLDVAQSATFRSLSSAKRGCSSRNRSSQSKPPSSGRQTGKTTSCLPLSGTNGWRTTTSSLAASRNIRQANGRLTCGVGPKWTCNVEALYVTEGYSALPRKLAGNAWALPHRSPFTKSDIVFAF